MTLACRILLTVFFILLARPAWAEAARQVDGIFWNDARDSLVVEANGAIRPRTSRLDNPLRYVIDLPNAKMKQPYVTLPGNSRYGVVRVRVGHVSANTVRVVFDLTRSIEPQIEQTEGKLLLSLRTSSAAPVLNVPRPRGIIHGVRLQGRSFLVAMSPRRPYWSHVWPLSAGKIRVSLVFPQTSLAPGVFGTVAIRSNGVERIVAAQRGTDARIDFECAGTPKFDIVPHAQGWLLVSANDPDTPVVIGGQQPRPDPVPSSASAAPLTLRQVGDEWLLTLSADERLRYKVTTVGDDRLYLEIMGPALPLPRDSVYIDNGLIARVRTQTKRGNQTRLMIDFDQAVRHRSRLLASGRSVELALRRSGKSKVTLDPGHGGTDTGTTGRGGTREKDVTLAVASRLAKNLEKNGISVQMTRMRDLEILLRPRVEMANRNDSEVFISIHANSFGNNQSVNGIETYYFNEASYPLARAIHQSLVRTLNRPDRGVRKNNFYVVNHTKMPAALVEIGYLSNPEEEALLKDPLYQEKAAQAIYDGVQQFMKSRRNIH